MQHILARAEKRGTAPELDLPELDPDEYLAQIMMDLKPTRTNGMEIGPTDWPVIQPFGEAIGLEADDMVILSKMCRGYHEAWREGENPLCIPPVERSDNKGEREDE